MTEPWTNQQRAAWLIEHGHAAAFQNDDADQKVAAFKALAAAEKATTTTATPTLADDVSHTHPVDPNASPVVRLQQMIDGHAKQKELERQFEQMGGALETEDEVKLWIAALLEAKVNTFKVLNWVVYNMPGHGAVKRWMPDELRRGLDKHREMNHRPQR